MAVQERLYATEVFYVNNYPHILRHYELDAAGERKFHSEQRYPVIAPHSEIALAKAAMSQV